LRIVVIGAGYVGLVTASCFAELGNQVTCIDTNQNKIDQLKKGIMPLYEPGLEQLILNNLKAKRLTFSDSFKNETDIIFIAVGTPSDREGSADTQYVLDAAKAIGQHIKSYCIIVDKSTVPVGVSEKVGDIIQAELEKRHLTVAFDVVSNPEFLRQGAAIDDFMKPDRIIVGTTSVKAKSIIFELYRPLLRNPEKIFFMNIKDAEMTKYVANAFLATKISFMNEMALLCEQFGVDIDNVRMGIGADSRIGPAFIYPGCGFGGSCFPKDIQALIKMAEMFNFNPLVLHAVSERNRLQKQVLAEKIIKVFGNNLSNITIGVWGLSFKPDTDDMREASSLVLLEQLIACQARIKVYDPVAMQLISFYVPENWLSSGQLMLAKDQYHALEAADALVLVTEWKPFCYPDLNRMKKRMRRPLIFDGRNQYDPKQLNSAGFEYYGIGRSHTN